MLRLNEWARSRMSCPTELAVIPGAMHLFEEPGALERAACLATAWFLRRLAPAPNLSAYEERGAGSIGRGRGRGRCSAGCPAAGD